VKYCKKCVMNDKRPGIKFNDEGICYPCLNAEKTKTTDWDKRDVELKRLAKRYHRGDNYYDCIIPASGGKDSYFQTFVMKEYLGMNPLIVCVKDPFSHTQTGEENLYNMCDSFDVDLITYTLSPDTTRKMVRLAFENFGSPNWPIDLAIYSVPLKMALQLGIELVVYGEDISYTYGGPDAVETYSAKNQIKNNVVQPIDWKWWYSNGINKKDVEFIKYPSGKLIDELEPIYLSYFFDWNGKTNAEFAKNYGFKTLDHEWIRNGFIEQYDQIDSVGYLLHPWLKYPKFGHARATDVACNWIRNGDIKREEGIKLVNENDHKLDELIVEDFLNFTGYSYNEFYEILNKLYNRDLFEFKKNVWTKKFNLK